MAKETDYSPVILFLASGILLACGWLMTTFPILIFVGMAPLFALTDRARDSTSAVWEKMEWTLFALIISFLAARILDISFVVSAMVYAILFTMPFIGYVWVRQTLGSRAGKITIVLFWLSIEYLLLKVRPENTIFLADALRLQPGWMRWNIHTGYLGSTLWILMANWLVYQTLLSANSFRWYWIVIAVLFLAGPIAYSYSLKSVPITRDDMVNLYFDKSLMKDVTYLARGEWVVRTAAWLSTLILLFTFVKGQTTKR